MADDMNEDMNGIFISYRRDESVGHAGRIADRFIEHFGEDKVFRDIDSLEPGLDFAEAINRAVDSSEVLIAVIGKNWVTATDAAGRKRLENPDDYVRIEIASALRRNIRVIPVLVQGASMPSGEQLPEDLAPLARRNAFELHDSSWTEEVRRLITTLDTVLGRRQVGGAQERERPPEVGHGVFSPVDRLLLWQYALGLGLVVALALFTIALGMFLTWQDYPIIIAVGFVILSLGPLSSAVVFGWWIGFRLRNPRFRSRITALGLLVGVALALVQPIFINFVQYRLPFPPIPFSALHTGGLVLLGAVCFVSGTLLGNVRQLRRTARINGTTPGLGLWRRAILGWSMILIMGALNILAFFVFEVQGG